MIILFKIDCCNAGADFRDERF
ncbi:hypothetical protein BOS5A_230553 [Bosea sp. EC-HK365B]|nr:hypothetical protein BOSE7B_60037 [Bosea sp. 7B]CAD5297343.1 hypothetical protein BOSE21B_90626 [Bosea sp. 21B]VVT61276.1 hypothetical protein BOS5A_230553 [Bosea sp. EC-HK365B]VXB21937.1 hypothetical protein BOSE127_110037 [Bosea sp. 127]